MIRRGINKSTAENPPKVPAQTAYLPPADCCVLLQKSGVLWSDKNGGAGGVGAVAAQDPLLAHQAHQWLSQYWNTTASPWNIDVSRERGLLSLCDLTVFPSG